MAFLALLSSSKAQRGPSARPQPNQHPENRMSNVEQGISNDEVEFYLFFPSDFVIRYSIFCGSLLNI